MLLGGSGTGKTSLINRLVDDVFLPKPESYEVGKSKTIVVDKRPATLEVHDTTTAVSLCLFVFVFVFMCACLS